MRRSTVRTLRRALRGTALVVGGLGLALIMVHSFSNALLRTVLDAPVSDTLEYVSGWYMPTVVFSGLVLAQANGDHIDANLVMSRAPERVQRRYGWAMTALTVLTMLGIAVFTALEAFEQQQLGTVVGVTSIPQWPFVYAVPVGAIAYAAELVLAPFDVAGTTDQRHEAGA